MRGFLNRGVDERGAILPFVALALVALFTATSITIDIGRISNRRRDLQAVADMVAMDAATRLQGQTLAEARSGDLLDEVLESANRNGFVLDSQSPAAGAVDAGGVFTPGATPVNAWRIDEADSAEWLLAALGTFPSAAVGFVPATGDGDEVTAVRVAAGDDVDYALAPFSIADASTDRRAIALATSTAGVGVRTELVTVDSTQSALLDELIADRLGISASVVGYDGLAGATVTLDDLVAELDAGSVDQLLAGGVAADELFAAQATLLRNGGDTARADLLDAIALQLVGTTVALGELLVVESGGAVAAGSAQLDVLDLLTATALVANGDNALTLTGTQLGIPGVGNVPVGLTVIEPPQYRFGPVGITARTAQVQLTIEPELATDPVVLGGDKCQLLNSGLIGNLLQLVDCVVLGLLQVVNVSNLVAVSVTGSPSLTLDLARGEATLTDIGCRPVAADRTATVDPLFGALDLGVSGSLTADATLLGTDVVTLDVAVDSEMTIGPRDPDPMVFTAADFGTFRSADDAGLGLLSLDASSVAVTGNATVLGLSTTSVSVDAAIVSALLTPLNAVVEQVVSNLDAVLGLGVASGDVVAFAPACAASRLVG